MITSESLSGSLRIISEKIFASKAIRPRSEIDPSTVVSIPNSISLPVSLISSADASIRIHSNIFIVVLDGIAFETILIPFIRDSFLKISFMLISSFPFGKYFGDR